MFKTINKRIINFLMGNKILGLKKNIDNKGNGLDNVSKFLGNGLREMQNQVKKQITREKQ